jgi:hypothetical protein
MKCSEEAPRSTARKAYGIQTQEMRIYIFPCKADREAWLQEDSDNRSHLGSNTFVSDMRLHAIHHGTAAANEAFVSPKSPLQFQGGLG